jgi:hypothetical protein
MAAYLKGVSFPQTQPPVRCECATQSDGRTVQRLGKKRIARCSNKPAAAQFGIEAILISAHRQACLSRELLIDLKHDRENVYAVVCIEMAWLKAEGTKAGELGTPLCEKIVWKDVSKLIAMAGKATALVHQTGNLRSVKDRAPVSELKVKADATLQAVAMFLHPLEVKWVADHCAGCGHNPFLHCTENALRDTFRQAKVVGMDEQQCHGAVIFLSTPG